MNEIISNFNLNCTEQEFLDYKNSIENPEIVYTESVHTFDELYNGNTISNPTDNTSALYYVMNFNLNWSEITFLQDIVPYVSGVNAITVDNINEIKDNHKNQILSEIIDGYKINKTIEYFKNI